VVVRRGGRGGDVFRRRAGALAMIARTPPEQPLEVVEVFDAYDGPRLFSATDASGRLFMALWVDDDRDGSVWLYLPLSPARLAALENRAFDLRTAFLESEAGLVFRVTQSAKGGTRVSEVVQASSVAREELPEPGEFLRNGAPRPSRPAGAGSGPPAARPLPRTHTESAFEKNIEDYLLGAGGYTRGDPAAFDRERAIFPADVLAFVQATQPETWQSLEKLHGPDTGAVILDDLTKALDGQAGALSVIRHGFKCFGKLIRVAHFAPAHGMNPDSRRLYEANRLTLTRQLHYSTKNENSIDLLISLNGIPVATGELKNPLTGQTAEHAKHQYKSDRDPRERIFEFKRRTLVHFAVDPDVVWMTTRVEGSKTVFLPFNKGSKHGAGNPENPGGYKTAYLWEAVWKRDALLDILGRFVHLQVEEKTVGAQKVRKETMIFPRYHQWVAVRGLEASARQVGVGTNYLIQHSAGSGKSNSIAWLAHRLASLHNDQDEKVFDSVVVITDRLVLDRQLQDTIYQFDHKQGVVQKIDEVSEQLAASLKAGTPIVVTTLQKFPFVTDKVGELPERKYAVVIDEAHSSQSGEAATELKGVLAGTAIKKKAEEEAQARGLADYEEEILKTIARRGRQPNISFFAFTATPKFKTLEVFGRPGGSGKPEPFHLYSMRQAIEEGFILDVLKNYTTYKTYYRLIKAIEDDPQVNRSKAAKALARFMSLHPHNIAQKTEVMLEHFRTFTKHKIAGRAKAMVVTGSRLHAVRYKQEFDRQILEKRYRGIKTLVAFSGMVEDPDLPGVFYTEPEMNRDAMGRPIREKELPNRFGTEEYQLLIVAEKYQTGFDQPLLHTMYVDKRLDGIQAVQTLSRLNRTCPGKEDTFVLDFVNAADDIQNAFRPYYEQTLVGDRADPRQLYELQANLEAMHVYHLGDVEDFCAVFFKPREIQTPSDHAKMNASLDPAVARFRQLDEEAQDEFRGLLNTFRNLYGFLSQVIPFQDSDLEKLYTYARFLGAKLPRRSDGEKYVFDDEVALKFYRLQKISEGSIRLDKGENLPVEGPTAVGTGAAKDDKVELSRLIDLVNERFGTDFTQADELFFHQIREEALADEGLRQAAVANTLDNFRYVFAKALEGLFIDRMEQNEELFAKYMNDPDFKKLVSEHLLRQVYEQIREEGAA
jgi:type I restriction enzyme R subunit